MDPRLAFKMLVRFQVVVTVTVGVGTALAMMTDVLVLVKVFQISVDICKKNCVFSLRVHDLKTPVLGFATVQNPDSNIQD